MALKKSTRLCCLLLPGFPTLFFTITVVFIQYFWLFEFVCFLRLISPSNGGVLIHLFILGEWWGRRGVGHAVGGEHNSIVEAIFPANMNKGKTHFRLENEQLNET